MSFFYLCKNEQKWKANGKFCRVAMLNHEHDAVRMFGIDIWKSPRFSFTTNFRSSIFGRIEWEPVTKHFISCKNIRGINTCRWGNYLLCWCIEDAKLKLKYIRYDRGIDFPTQPPPHLPISIQHFFRLSIPLSVHQSIYCLYWIIEFILLTDTLTRLFI